LGGLPAVELRLGEKRAGRLEDVIGPTQFPDLTLQCLELVAFACAQAFALAVVNFIAFDPFIDGLWLLKIRGDSLTTAYA
jgi:hypothetical protein